MRGHEIIRALNEQTGFPRRDLMTEALPLFHSAAHACSGRVIGPLMPDNGTCCSFDFIELAEVPGVAAVLLHRDAPFVALSGVKPCGEPRIFVDQTTFTDCLRAFGNLHVLDAEVLNADLSRDNRKQLTGISNLWAHDMNYWKPETLGEALFNFWD